MTVDFMTDESDDTGDTNTLAVHQLQWQSKSECTIIPTYMPWCVHNGKMFLYIELIDFLTLLDKRYEEKVKKEGTFMARKLRHNGTPLTCGCS